MSGTHEIAKQKKITTKLHATTSFKNIFFFGEQSANINFLFSSIQLQKSLIVTKLVSDKMQINFVYLSSLSEVKQDQTFELYEKLKKKTISFFTAKLCLDA